MAGKNRALAFMCLLALLWGRGCFFPRACASSGFVPGNIVERDGVTYMMRNDGTLSVTAVDGAAQRKRITIPRAVDGYRVTTVASGAFTSLKSSVRTARDVVLSEGVERAEKMAFGGTVIRTLSLPSSLTKVSEGAFEAHIERIRVDAENPVLGMKDGFLYNRQNGYLYWYSAPSGQQKIVIPGEVKMITETSAFYTGSASQIRLSSGLARAKLSASYDKYRQLAVIIPKEMTRFPKGITVRQSGPEGENRGEFYHPLAGAGSVAIEEGNPVFALEGGLLIDRSAGEVVWCADGDLTETALPEGIVSIADGAFSHHRNLACIRFPSTLRSIGAYAFAACRKLGEAVLPERCEAIGACAFAGCRNLKRIWIPLSIKDLAPDAFDQCENAVPEFEQPGD